MLLTLTSSFNLLLYFTYLDIPIVYLLYLLYLGIIMVLTLPCTEF